MLKDLDKEVIFVRHGALPENCRHCLVGQNDTPLSAAGVLEAQAAGRYLASVEFDAVYAGELCRVRQTLHEAGKSVPGLEANAVTDARLNEMDFGSWNMRRIDALDYRDAALLAQWNPGNFDFSFPGGETMGAFAERTRGFWRELMASTARRSVVFSHGGVIMSLVADLIGLDRREAFSVWIERGGMARTLVNSQTGTGRINLIGKPLDWGC